MTNPVSNAAPRVLPEGRTPNDARLGPLKHLGDNFPFTPAKSPAEWTARAARVRRRILVALGLWPMPEKTPLNPVIHGRIERSAYTVEKVYFESLPGFFVTGNLYRPAGRSGPVPGVLCPHGHWLGGRFMNRDRDRVNQELAQGAERFEAGARSVLQARCVLLARMGCVVFHYDMVGYADSVQIPFALAHELSHPHEFSRQRPEMNTRENWGLFSPQAEAHAQSVMGLHAWNSIRALDFLLGLPDVDPGRIACTGASGGGTQTFILGAIDERVNVAFPAVMVSTAMQGGCTCENASLLRIGTGNVEFAALFAPRPLGMTAADDWTKEMPAKGYPQLVQHYAMLGAPQNVMLKPLLHFGHNFNAVSRAVMASWFNQHLALGLPEPVLEADFQPLTQEELTVWDRQHPPSSGGPEFERRLLAGLTAQSRRQLEALAPGSEEFRRIVGGGVEMVMGRTFDETGPVRFDATASEDRGAYTETHGLWRSVEHGEELPAVCLQPKRWKRRTVLWVSGAGKAGLFRPGIRGYHPRAEIKAFLECGLAVAGVDLLYQGEFLADGVPPAFTRRVSHPREAAAFTFGYNHALFAQRIHDLLAVVKGLRTGEHKPQGLYVAGLDRDAGPWVAALLAVARGSIDRAALDTGGFRFGNLRDYHDPRFVPGGAKYGDLPGMLALGAPTPLWLAGEERQAQALVRAAYRAAGAERRLRLFKSAARSGVWLALDWSAHAADRGHPSKESSV